MIKKYLQFALQFTLWTLGGCFFAIVFSGDSSVVSNPIGAVQHSWNQRPGEIIVLAIMVLGFAFVGSWRERYFLRC